MVEIFESILSHSLFGNSKNIWRVAFCQYYDDVDE